MNDRGRKKKKGRDYAFAKDDRSRCIYTLWNYSLGKKKKKIASFNFVRNIFHFYKGIIADLRSCFGNFRINKLKKICKTKGRV